MKCIVMAPGFEDELVADPSSIAGSFLRELQKLGVQVQFISIADNRCNYNPDACSAALGLINQGFAADFILVSDWGPWAGEGWNKQNFPDTLLVYEAGDEPQSLPSHFPKSSQADIVLTPSHTAAIYYASKNVQSIWFPQYAISDIYCRDFDITRSGFCVTSCGDRGPTSRYLTSHLSGRFINEKVYGPAHAAFLASGDIVFQESKNREITRRLFEGMALGKMVIADRPRPEERHDMIFVEGHDIVWYDSPDDARQKIEYYLKNDSERIRIANNGMQKVRTLHTDTQRVKSLVDIVKGIRK